MPKFILKRTMKKYEHTIIEATDVQDALDQWLNSGATLLDAHFDWEDSGLGEDENLESIEDLGTGDEWDVDENGKLV
jgi:hypothetical protein